MSLEDEKICMKCLNFRVTSPNARPQLTLSQYGTKMNLVTMAYCEFSRHRNVLEELVK